MRVAQDIVSSAGEVVNRRAESEDYEGGNFMQVRVKIDVRKPLSRGRKIGLSNGEESWTSLKYECLPNLCYWCGRLTHHDKDCSVWLKRKGTMKEKNQNFGLWLRAITPNLAKKTVICVSGYEEEVREDNRAALGQERNDERGIEAWNEIQNHSATTEPDEQQMRTAVQALIGDAVTPAKNSSVCMSPAQEGGSAS
ncbi:hypothetical protein SO802_016567 [Lithocarpus litseifolius]|uniref:Zinc knuckle CX2CX4HX4C domain-containing protein n=1 Tax=Lithocarpus litseifolius TaxID=425828 RepID=A0AAW2CXJ7_9ROSI